MQIQVRHQSRPTASRLLGHDVVAPGVAKALEVRVGGEGEAWADAAQEAGADKATMTAKWRPESPWFTWYRR